MKDNYTLSTKLIVDTISCVHVFMCELKTTNDIKQARVYTLKKTEKNKIRKCILTLSHFLAESIYTPGFKISIF